MYNNIIEPVTFSHNSIDKYSFAQKCGFMWSGINDLGDGKEFLHKVHIRSFTFNGDTYLGFLKRNCNDFVIIIVLKSGLIDLYYQFEID